MPAVISLGIRVLPKFNRVRYLKDCARARAEGEEITKTPGEFEPPKPITKAERAARKAFRQVDAEKAMTEHEIAQKAFSANWERLKAERLKGEAAGPPVTAKKAKAKEKAR